jgi:hypothetical protein
MSSKLNKFKYLVNISLHAVLTVVSIEQCIDFDTSLKSVTICTDILALIFYKKNTGIKHIEYFSAELLFDFNNS